MVSLKTPSIRDIARALDISHTTVSQALRGKTNVKLATRKRIQAAAEAAGYKCNPLAGRLMSEMRCQRGGAFSGTVAIIDVDGPSGRSPASAEYHKELSEGAAERAAELGYKLVTFGTEKRKSKNIMDAVRAECIQGAFVLPVIEPAILTGVDWSHCAAVYADYCEGSVKLHSICPDHFEGMRTILKNLHALGYRRPGIVLNQSEENRLFHRWEKAFRFFAMECSSEALIPALVAPDLTLSDFSRWFKKYDPDVVIGHASEVMDWMTNCGAEIAQTHGFCCLNSIKNPDIACAGLDLQPRVIGARGIELVIAQLQRSEFGTLDHPMNTTVPAVWVDGPTLRGDTQFSA